MNLTKVNEFGKKKMNLQETQFQNKKKNNKEKNCKWKTVDDEE